MRESIRRDRARIQIGRISNFGLLEMTRQRLERRINKMGNSTITWFFCTKILKNSTFAFTDKVKIIKSFIPEKVKFLLKII